MGFTHKVISKGRFRYYEMALSESSLQRRSYKLEVLQPSGRVIARIEVCKDLVGELRGDYCFVERSQSALPTLVHKKCSLDQPEVRGAYPLLEFLVVYDRRGDHVHRL